MSRMNAMQKAKKILGCFDDIEPRKYCVQPYAKSNEKSKHDISFSSASKSSSKVKRDFSFCKSKSKQQERSMSSINSSCLK